MGVLSSRAHTVDDKNRERRIDPRFEAGRADRGGLACAGARSLVPGHLDAELSEPQARELRAHLLDCADCRATLRDETNLRRWFEAGRPDDVPVPSGFAERVARRAFQGDPGIDFAEDESVVAAPAPRGQLLPFLLRVTTAVAALLLGLAMLLQQETLPEGDQLRADDYVPPWQRAAEIDSPADVPAETDESEDADDAKRSDD